MGTTAVDPNAETFSDTAEMSWNRERTGEELRFFIERHHAALPMDISVE